MEEVRVSDARDRGFLLGRTSELQMLVARTDAVASLRRGAISFVVGEAGIGKSALIARFVNATFRRVCVIELEGRARAPLGPMLELLRACGHSEFAELESDAFATRFSNRQAFYRAAVAGLSEPAGPIALVVENAHWLDRASLEFVTELMQQIETLPFHIVLTMREATDVAGSSQRTFVESAERDARCIRLHALDGATMRDLVASSERIDPDSERARWIVEHADGNPHVALELAGASRLAVASGGGWRDFAATVRDAVMRRYLRLSATDRRVLDVAACIGRRFEATSLASAVGRSPLDIAGALRHAIESGLLDENADGEFSFRHETTREIIYARMLIFESRAIHASIAEQVERDAPAGATRDAVAFEQWSLADNFERALPVGMAVAQRAVVRFAYDDAIAMYERLLEMTDDAEQRARLYDLMSFAHSRAARLAVARDTLKLACEAAAFSADPELRARLAHRLAIVQYNLWETRDADATLETISEILGDRRESIWLFRMHVSKALASVQRTDVTGAERHLEIARSLPGDDARSADATFLRVSAEVCAAAGDVDGWLAASDRALAFALADNGDSRVVTVRISRAIEAANLGLVALGVEAATRAAREAELARLENYRTYALALRGWLRCESGDLAGAARDAGESRIPGSLGYEPATILAATVAAATCDRDALDAIDMSDLLERAEKSRSGQQFAVAAYAAIVAALARGEQDRASALLGRAIAAVTSIYGCGHVLALAGSIGSIADVGAVRRLFARDGIGPRDAAFGDLFEARVAARDGRARAAQRHAAAAARRFEELGMRLWLVVALELSGRVDDARAIAETFGDRAFSAQQERSARQINRRGRSATTFTKRELDVAMLLDGVLTNREIGDRLGIGHRTVETHIATILRKTGARTRHEAVALVRGSHVSDS